MLALSKTQLKLLIFLCQSLQLYLLNSRAAHASLCHRFVLSVCLFLSLDTSIDNTFSMFRTKTTHNTRFVKLFFFSHCHCPKLSLTKAEKLPENYSRNNSNKALLLTCLMFKIFWQYHFIIGLSANKCCQGRS